MVRIRGPKQYVIIVKIKTKVKLWIDNVNLFVNILSMVS